MKKILSFLVLMFLYLGASSQVFPVNATFGSPSSTVLTKGIAAADSGYQFRTNFADTTTANYGNIDQVPGVMIRTGSTLWIRNQATTAWVQIGTGAGGTPTLQEVLTAGNILTKNDTIDVGGFDFNYTNYGTMLFDGGVFSFDGAQFLADASLINVGARAGSIRIDSDSISVSTSNGDINIEQLRSWAGTTISDTTYKKVMTWDTRNGRVEYSNWLGAGGGGSGTVTSVGTGYGLSGGAITTSGTLLLDSATVANYFMRRKDSLTTSNALGYVTKKTLADTAAALRSLTSYITIDKRYDSLAWRRNDSTFLVKSLRLQLNGSDITPTSTDSTLSWNIISSGSSNTFTQGLTESGGTVKLDNNRNIEYITQPTTGAALGSGWAAVSSPTYSVTDGKFVFTGGTNNYTQYIRNDAGVLSENASVEAYVIINTAGTTDQGVRIGWKSYNSFGYAHDVHAGYISGTSASNTGKAILYGSTGSSSNYSDSARTSSDGDTLYYKLTRNGLAYTIYVKNITKGWKLSKTVQTTPLGSPFVAHNSAYVAVIPGAGAYTVYGLKYTIHAPLVTENYIVGNSITYGQSASSEGARYASRIGYPGNNIGSGGGADATAQVLSRVNEIKAINPKRVLLMIGGNDILFGVSSATWKANYLAIRDSLVNNGIEVVHLLPTPRTATDVSALKYYIDTSTTFRSDRIIDTWTPLYSGSGFSMLTKYNYDGTHPNEAGMGQIAATINDALHYNNGSTFEVNKNLIAKNGYVWGQDAGTGTDQYKAGGLIAAKSNSTTSYGQIGFISDYMYLQGIIEGSEYTKISLSPGIGSPRIGIGEISPSAPLHIKNTVAGNTTLMKLNHGGSFSDVGQEFGIEFQNAGTSKSKIVSYIDPDGLFGLKFYGETADGGGGVSARPTLWFTAKDTATYTSGKLTIGKNLYITGVQSGVGDKQVRFNSSTKEVTYVDTIKTLSYTPTLTNTTNIAASTAYTTHYTVVGDMVTVWGTVDIDATAAATITEMGMSLPFAAGISQIYDLAGTAAFEDNTSVQIKGDNSNGRAMFRFTPQTNTNNKYSFQFTYKWVAP